MPATVTFIPIAFMAARMRPQGGCESIKIHKKAPFG